jgi:hypothetical protein
MSTSAGVFVPPRPGDDASHAGEGALVTRLRAAAPWWALPTTVVVVLGGFIVYSMWTATKGTGVPQAADGHQVAPYLSPFYSPEWLVGHFPFFTAAWALVVPVLFRGTCYYYRKAYHRSFFLDPPACAIPEPRHGRYRGETALPFVLNNLHRFAFYLAAVYIVILSYDAVNAFSLGGKAYIGLGTGIMLLNVALLSGYTFSCHSFRHLVGGGIDCWSCVRFGSARHSLWRWVSALNLRHANWAWVSLFSVLSVDVYIRMLNAGWFTDPHILGG